jgi:hypothetical protein
MFTLIARVTDGKVPQFVNSFAKVTQLTSQAVMFNTQQAEVMCSLLNEELDGKPYHYIGISVERKYDDSKAVCSEYDMQLTNADTVSRLANVNWKFTNSIRQLMR